MTKEMRVRQAVRFGALLAVALIVASVGAANAAAGFGVETGSFDGRTTDEAGNATTQAGGHPFSVSTKFALNKALNEEPGENYGFLMPVGRLRNSTVELPPGVIGNPRSVPQCSLAEFKSTLWGACADSTQVGIAASEISLFGFNGYHSTAPIYNLTPNPGAPALFGFYALTVPVLVEPSVRYNGDYGLDMTVSNVTGTGALGATELTFWGTPSSHALDYQRGYPEAGTCSGFLPKPCPSEAPNQSFLTNSVDCSGQPAITRIQVESWEGETDEASFVSHDNEGNPIRPTGCDAVPFHPTLSSLPTVDSGDTPTGLDFSLSIPADGLESPTGVTESPVKAAVVRMPKGMVLNSGSAQGLGVCTAKQYEAEDMNPAPGTGCPNSSKLGTIDIETPLLQEHLKGAVYLAQPDDPTTADGGAENPFDSLVAVYLVARAPERGVIIKLAGKIESDESTGQLVTRFVNLPQLPFSTLNIHFRGGARAPLVVPKECATYTTVAELTPWSAEDASDVKRVTSDFTVSRGPGGGACLPGNAGFDPGFVGGSVNNAAGSYSPFSMRLTRNDDEQELTKFNAVLPQGILAKLKGMPACPESAIAAAKAKTGREEIASPSCPASSEIGQTEAGAGVGSVLTYVPGHLYLGGPYKGAPLSVIAITPAVAGPFDVGTVVVHQALRVDPVTAQATADGSVSDPIPQILKGIPLNLRDLRVHLNRADFMTTPTSCDPTQVDGALFGSGGAIANLSTRYQAASCQSLGFRPRLNLRLFGKTHRSAHPRLRAVLTAREGDANIAGSVVTLPKTEFLENAHIRTICTRVQYAADSCPKGSIYGYAKAWSPLLDKPLQGPVYLRSSNHPLPDLVASLDGQIHIDLAGRIDSVHSRMRATFDSVPDAPVSKFVLDMQGGRKGLLVNNTELCTAKPRAAAQFTGHNGKVSRSNPLVQASCGSKHGKRNSRHRR